MRQGTTASAMPRLPVASAVAYAARADPLRQAQRAKAPATWPMAKPACCAALCSKVIIGKRSAMPRLPSTPIGASLKARHSMFGAASYWTVGCSAVGQSAQDLSRQRGAAHLRTMAGAASALVRQRPRMPLRRRSDYATAFVQVSRRQLQCNL